MSIQMKQKELTKTFMMIATLVSLVYNTEMFQSVKD